MGNWISKTVESIESSGIRKMFNIASDMSDVVNLGIGEPDFATPQPIVEAAQKGIEEGSTHYTPNAGTEQLRLAVAEKLNRVNRIPARADKNIIITCGAMGGLYLTLRSVLNKGDEVLLPRPSWTNYEAQIVLSAGRVVSVPTGVENGFAVTPRALEKKITAQTKALIINTPANPTGGIYTRTSLEGIAELARKHELLVISDEVYEKFIWEGCEHISIASLPGMAERTVTINSFSKSYAMTGWRVGYTAGSEELIRAMTKLQEDIYACAPSVSQAAAVAALARDEECTASMIGEYKKRREYILSRLCDIPKIKVTAPLGSFYVFIDIRETGMGSDELALELLKKGRVCVIPGSAFGKEGEGYVRISYTAGCEKLAVATNRIARFIDSL